MSLRIADFIKQAMALNKKKSRPIQVNHVGYRYQISTTKTDDEGNFTLNLTIQAVNTHGRVLKVLGLITRNYWLDCPHLSTNMKHTDYPIITPKYVARVICLARQKGWKPEASGPPFDLTMQNEEFFNDRED